jgi:diaminopimelate decarboxylase
MHAFTYQGDALCCEDVSVERIAAEVGTPFYLYSRATLERHFTVFDSAFRGVPHLTCYSVKANSNLAVLNLFARAGAGADVVSGGEIFRALKAGIPAAKIVYSGVGKTRSEIAYGLECGILMFNVESSQELEMAAAAAQEAGTRARIALRVNPDIDPQTHPYISTGLKKNKFGIMIDEALQFYRQAAANKHLEVAGLACHIGSQITQIGPFVDALRRLKAFVSRLLEQGISIQYLDLGGGLGITYADESPPPPAEYARAIVEELQALPCTLILEPGRVIVGNAGVLIARVLYTKSSGDKHFIIVDAAMNDLVRPSLYEAYHEILPVRQAKRARITADIVGPICESGDFLARGRQVPELAPGDYIAVMSAGAYGFSMSSNYNSRPRVPEILVDGKRHHVIRTRESYEDLVRLEDIPGYA